MFEILRLVKSVVVALIYLAFLAVVGGEFYQDIKSLAVKAHHRGVVEMSEWSRELLGDDRSN